jgi:hypothetical protein
VVARRKTPKGERELPPIAYENPYALLTRDELQAALLEVDDALATLAPDSPKRLELKAKRTLIVQGDLWRMVRVGIGTWAGGKPIGSDPPIEVTPGPYVSDYVIEDRR